MTKKRKIIDIIIIILFILIGVGLFGYTYYAAKESLSKKEPAKKELRSLELYSYNLEFMLNAEESDEEKRGKNYHN